MASEASPKKWGENSYGGCTVHLHAIKILVAMCESHPSLS